MLPSRTLSVSIHRPPSEVVAFVRDGRNLPRWAAGLGSDVRPSGDGWEVTTPAGPVHVRFEAPNDLGVVDHVVRTPERDVVVPMRVLDNDGGSELLFTLYRQPDMTDASFEADAAAVARDLQTLRELLELGSPI